MVVECVGVGGGERLFRTSSSAVSAVSAVSAFLRSKDGGREALLEREGGRTESLLGVFSVVSSHVLGLAI